MKKLVLLTAFSAMILVCCHINQNFILPPDVTYINADGPVPERIFLDQSWPDSIRNKFWFTSQGSQIMPYDWFTYLEQATNTKFFRNTDHMEALGYLPSNTSKYNPSGLPIGFAMTNSPSASDSYMGMTCAACHTNQLNYNGKKYLIDGAPTLANFVLFFEQLVAALNATYEDDAKFERFARRVLKGTYNKANAKELREDLLDTAIKSGQRQLVNNLPDNYPHDFTSYGRLDAFGNIENAGSAFALNDLTNRNAPTAPVSYPFLWGTHQSDFVQWNASAPNTPIVGPLVRNTGEVVGVFGGLEIKEASWIKKLFGKHHIYSSTVDYHGLGALEGYVKLLKSPEWEETSLPPVDESLVRQGAILYGVHCSGCHQVIPRENEYESYKIKKIDLTDVGTDPMMAWSVENHYAKTLSLEGYKTDIIVGDRFGDTTRSLDISLNGVIGLVLKNPVKALEAGLITRDVKTKTTWEEQVHYHASIQDSLLEEKAAKVRMLHLAAPGSKDLTGLVYKARPLNGIWATAPYLHNGSVPNLWSLLQQAQLRPESFWVGSREFDPVNVGYVTDRGKNLFKVKDSNGNILEGNSNLGHDYGTGLTQDEKKALLEYMKTL